MEYFISAAIGYLFGSVPTAYLFLKKIYKIDITESGSKNVGAMNSFEITRSKKIGVAVFIIDFLKGIIPVLIIWILLKQSFILSAIAILFAVFSHCFNPWLKFNGGRGLATAAGGSVVIYPVLLFAWALIWVITFILRRDILIGNIIATVLSIITIFFISNYTLSFTHPAAVNVNELILFSCSGLIIIFIKHIEPLKEILSKNKQG